MATVTGFTADRMRVIENTCIVAGAIDLSGRLQLTRRDGITIDAGSVIGPKGDPGIKGDTGPQGIPGEPGANGVSTYVWIKYADTPLTGMSDDPRVRHILVSPRTRPPRLSHWSTLTTPGPRSSVSRASLVRLVMMV